MRHLIWLPLRELDHYPVSEGQCTEVNSINDLFQVMWLFHEEATGQQEDMGFEDRQT